MTRQELLNKRLAQYLQAEEKILLNQSYTIGERTYNRADLDIVRKMIENLLEQGAQLDGEENQFSRAKRVVFID